MDSLSVRQYNQVLEFMQACDQTVNKPEDGYKSPTFKVGNLRIALIQEEVTELYELGIIKDNAVEILDALCDILYVTYGALATLGIPAPKFEMDLCGREKSSVNNLLSMHVSNQFHSDLQNNLDVFKTKLLHDSRREIQYNLNNIISLCFEMASESNMDLEGAFNEVHNSNMSKFSTSYEEALEHCKEQYKLSQSKVIDPRIVDKMRAYNPEKVDIVEVQLQDKILYAIKRKSDGKGLKGVHFFEPDLSKYLK